MIDSNNRIDSYAVGLTGGIASGKSTVSQMFAAHNITIIDTDDLARKCVLPGSEALEKIMDHFGHSVINHDGTLNRRKLRSLVFSQPNEKKWLESCLHPLIHAMVLDGLKASSSPYTIIEIPLLVENHTAYQWLKAIITVDCSEAKQIERLMQRDNISRKEALAILEIQSSRAKRQSIADHVIINDGSRDTLSKEVNKLHQLFMKEVSSPP